MVDITDEQIAAAVRPLYTDDAAASMGLADDIRTARAVLALRPSASAAPGWKLVPVEPKDRDDSTGLRFPEFKGWRIIATDLGRYTLTVVFARRAQEEET